MTSIRIVVASVLLALFGTVAAAQGRRYTADDLRAAGKALVDSVIRADGLLSDPGPNQDVRNILAILQRRAGYGEPITPYIIRKNDLNAFAAPGGHILVYDGLLKVIRRAAGETARGDTAVARRTYVGFLAATLAHELAHHTLGHTRRLMRQEGTPAELLQESRERELAADRVGGFYLLWSGWEIQDAMDLQRLLDMVERQSPGFYGLEQMTYFRTHPRGSLREAELEAFRAELKRDQVRFDDALALTNSNVGHDLAIALLDTVIADFPYLTEAYHARGTAYHLKWLTTVPTQGQQVQASLPTYGAHFLPGIRGAPGDTALLVAARRDYDRAMTLELRPGTLSNMALLDAYSGRTARAQEGARRAASLAPTSARVLNNLGVVLYLSKQPAAARTAFEQARSQPGWSEYPPLLFNLGRTLTQLHDPQGRAFLERYIALDAKSDWRREALALLGSAPTPSAPVAFDAPPALSGVNLGDSPGDVAAALGAPEGRVQGEDGEIWKYPSRGIVLFMSPQDGVTAILLGTRDAGAVEGVRVGDPSSAATTRWGQPNVSPEGIWFFGRSGWGIVARPEDSVLVFLGITRR